MNKIFTSSKSDNWGTPDWLYKQLDDEFHFRLDAAANSENTKCKLFFSYINGSDNALTHDWYSYYEEDGVTQIKSIWCNPSYNNLQDWIVQGYEASLHGCTVVFLLPTTKCDQTWWHEYVVKHAAEIRFIEGRVKFGGCANAAPFPSCIVVFKPNQEDWKVSSLRKLV